MKKLVLSPISGVTASTLNGYTPQDAVYDWTVGKTFMSNQHYGRVSISDADALYEQGFDTLVFTCGGSSTTLDLKGQHGNRSEQSTYSFHMNGMFHTDELEQRRLAYRFTGRDEPLYKAK